MKNNFFYRLNNILWHCFINISVFEALFTALNIFIFCFLRYSFISVFELFFLMEFSQLLIVVTPNRIKSYSLASLKLQYSLIKFISVLLLLWSIYLSFEHMPNKEYHSIFNSTFFAFLMPVTTHFMIILAGKINLNSIISIKKIF